MILTHIGIEDRLSPLKLILDCPAEFYEEIDSA